MVGRGQLAAWAIGGSQKLRLPYEMISNMLGETGGLRFLRPSATAYKEISACFGPNLANVHIAFKSEQVRQSAKRALRNRRAAGGDFRPNLSAGHRGLVGIWSIRSRKRKIWIAVPKLLTPMGTVPARADDKSGDLDHQPEFRRKGKVVAEDAVGYPDEGASAVRPTMLGRDRGVPKS